MPTTSKQTDIRTAPSDGSDNYIHIVSFKESIWNDKLRRKVPRALCGVLMTMDPDKAYPGANAPTCPKCKAIAGPCTTTFVPAKWR